MFNTSELGEAKTAYFSKMFPWRSPIDECILEPLLEPMKRAADPEARKTMEPVKREDDTIALVDQEKACIMNSYSATVGLNLASNFPQITSKRQGATSSPKDNRTVPLLKEVHISSLAIRNKIEAINATKSMGPADNIQPKLLRLAGGAIIPSLESLYRYSIETKTVFISTSWKTAKITPVFKKDNETDRGNYRPISLLSVPSRILESLVNAQCTSLL